MGGKRKAGTAGYRRWLAVLPHGYTACRYLNYEVGVRAGFPSTLNTFGMIVNGMQQRTSDVKRPDIGSESPTYRVRKYNVCSEKKIRVGHKLQFHLIAYLMPRCLYLY